MLKIYRLGPPTKDFIQLQQYNTWGANFDSLIGSKQKVCTLQRRNFCSTLSVDLKNRPQKLNVSSNVFPPKILDRSLVIRPKYNPFVLQKRHFSFQSTAESIAQTQSGIFKTLSESSPVEYCQKYLLYVHDLTGLPWWASIMCSTILVRAAITLPLAVYQQYILAKLENLKLDLPDIVADLKRETALAVKMFNWDERTARATYNRSLRKEWNNLIIRDNCHPFKASILLWFQIPLWISLSISFRNLVYMLPVQDIPAQLTYAELVVGGFGVIPNLTIPDTSWLFPVTLGLLNLIIIELQILSKVPNMQQKNKVQAFLTNTFRVLSVLMIPIAATVPSCLVLYWTTSSAYGLAQNIFLLSPKVKRLFKIPETAIEVKQPYKMVISNLKTKLKLL